MVKAAKITTKQRAARKRNIKVAQMAKSRNKKPQSSRSYRQSQRGGLKKGVQAHGRKTAGGYASLAHKGKGSASSAGKSAYKKAYKKARKSGQSKFSSNARGLTAAYIKSPKWAGKKKGALLRGKFKKQASGKYKDVYGGMSKKAISKKAVSHSKEYRRSWAGKIRMNMAKF